MQTIVCLNNVNSLDIFERITYLIDNEANGSAAKFGEMIGYSGQAIRYVSKLRRNNPNFEMIVSILQTFVWLNPDWLIMGIGEYRKSDIRVIEVTPKFLLDRVEELAIENRTLREENERLRSEKKGYGYSMVAEPREKLKKSTEK